MTKGARDGQEAGSDSADAGPLMSFPVRRLTSKSYNVFTKVVAGLLWAVLSETTYWSLVSLPWAVYETRRMETGSPLARQQTPSASLISV